MGVLVGKHYWPLEFVFPFWSGRVANKSVPLPKKRTTAEEPTRQQHKTRKTKKKQSGNKYNPLQLDGHDPSQTRRPDTVRADYPPRTQPSSRERDTSPLYVVKYLKRNETKMVCIYFHFTERQLHTVSLWTNRALSSSCSYWATVQHCSEPTKLKPTETHTHSKSRSLYKRTENKIGTSRHHRSVVFFGRRNVSLSPVQLRGRRMLAHRAV